MDSWEGFERAFKAQFCHRRWNADIFREFQRMEQGEGETLRHFTGEFRLSVNLMGSPLSERRQVDILLEIVRPEYRAEFIARHPRTLYEVRRIGEGVELAAELDRLYQRASRSTKRSEWAKKPKGVGTVKAEVQAVTPSSNNATQKRKPGKTRKGRAERAAQSLEEGEAAAAGGRAPQASPRAQPPTIVS